MKADRAGESRAKGSSLYPLLGGVSLDVLDLASVGPFGGGGLALGLLLGWVVAGMHQLPGKLRALCAVLAGIYCLTPMTEFVPLATIASVAARWALSRRLG